MLDLKKPWGAPVERLQWIRSLHKLPAFCQSGTGLSHTAVDVLLLHKWEQSWESNAEGLQAILDLHVHGHECLFMALSGKIFKDLQGLPFWATYSDCAPLPQ